MKMLQEIGEPQRAAEYVRLRRMQQQPVMGFGHRVYRTEDPRACQMRQMLQELSFDLHEQKWLHITDALIDAMQPYARHGIHINVDFYASIIYYLLHIPQDLSVSLFILGRMAGWLAQVLEQQENNILIRPLLSYIGEERRPYLPINLRNTSNAVSVTSC
jgi:citrate synthase